MANKTVALVRKCKTPDGWLRYPVVMSANGKVKPNAVNVAGVEVAYPVGHYELRSYVGSKVKYERVEGGATEALAALKVAQKRASAKVDAADAGLQIVLNPERGSLSDEAKKFIAAANDRGSLEAAEIYQRTLDEFLVGCRKTYADELVHEDVTRFHRQMRDRGLSPRTVSNRHMNLRAFLIYLKFDKAKVKEVAGPRPKFEKTMPEIYEPDELKTFFEALDSDYDRLLFDVLLQTGLREREAMHLEWVDISKARRKLKVESKPAYKHKVKDAEEREMPLPGELLAELMAYRENHKGDKLVFGKRGGTIDAPDGHLLRRCKIVAKNADLNCGTCKTCKSNKECERWFLHKFRATYCTTLLRAGMDLRTVQKMMGHSDLASTMRYLRPAEGDEVQNRVNAIQWR